MVVTTTSSEIDKVTVKDASQPPSLLSSVSDHSRGSGGVMNKDGKARRNSDSSSNNYWESYATSKYVKPKKSDEEEDHKKASIKKKKKSLRRTSSVSAADYLDPSKIELSVVTLDSNNKSGSGSNSRISKTLSHISETSERSRSSRRPRDFMDDSTFHHVIPAHKNSRRFSLDFWSGQSHSQTANNQVNLMDVESGEYGEQSFMSRLPKPGSSNRRAMSTCASKINWNYVLVAVLAFAFGFAANHVVPPIFHKDNKEGTAATASHHGFSPVGRSTWKKSLSPASKTTISPLDVQDMAYFKMKLEWDGKDEPTLDQVQALMCTTSQYIQEKVSNATGGHPIRTAATNVGWEGSGNHKHGSLTFHFTSESDYDDFKREGEPVRVASVLEVVHDTGAQLLQFLHSKGTRDETVTNPLLKYVTDVSLEALPEDTPVRAGELTEAVCLTGKDMLIASKNGARALVNEMDIDVFGVEHGDERALSESSNSTAVDLLPEVDDDAADLLMEEDDNEVDLYNDLDAMREFDDINNYEESQGLLYDFGGEEDDEEEDLTGEIDNYNLTRRRLNGLGPKINPLQCNIDANLENQPCTHSLSSLTNTTGEPVVVPCGKCYNVDTTDGSALWFPDGLIVKGKLNFPSSSNVVIRTKYVFVQGILKIVPPSAGNKIKFSLYQEEDVSFLNEAEPTGVCGENACNLGTKVIAVVGGQLDIQGYDSTCPTWEKLQAVGEKQPEPFVPPTNKAGDQVNLEIAGTCMEDPRNTEQTGKYTVWCPIKPTAPLHSGDSRNLVVTNIAPPTKLSPFEPPTSNGQSLSLKTGGHCKVSKWHTRVFNKCMIYCPLQGTIAVHTGDNQPMRWTSAKPPPEPTVLPDGFGLKIRGSCRESRPHTQRFGYTVRCPVEPTHAVHVGEKRKMKFVNPLTGQSLISDGVLVWAWRGGNLYFHPQVSDREVTQMFPRGSTMKFDFLSSDPAESPVPKQMDIESVHHWSWRGRGLYFTPYGYTAETCNQAQYDVRDAFPPGHGINIAYRNQAPVAGGQQIGASQGVHKWAFHGNKFFFHPDVTVGEVNRLFPVGYKMQISHKELTHVTQVSVSPAAASCWGAGTEIAISSHTTHDYDRQTAVVASVDATTGILTLDRHIATPITLEDSQHFAVEIASLNRPVVFEADSDADDSVIGGHLIVFKTETYQHLEGVEIRNFGQQGRLGRYPIHFHLCGGTSNSAVKRNAVVASNQRAYVMHCSDNVSLEENIAYDITGHCFFLEAGVETGTVWTKNLGFGVKNMPEDRVRLLDAKSKRRETDHKVSVFWISHAGNSFYGNVAGGSEMGGFRIEIFGPRGSKRVSLVAFEDNEGHSSWTNGLGTYPTGYEPDVPPVLRNTKMYRNRGLGISLHVTTNMIFEGGIIADNAGGALGTSHHDGVVFKDFELIGATGLPGYAPYCKSGVMGFPMSGLTSHPGEGGFGSGFAGTHRSLTLTNVKFFNWTEPHTACAESTAVNFMTPQVKYKIFETTHFFNDVVMDTPGGVDACIIEKTIGIESTMIAIASDAGSSFSPEGVPGFLASPKVATMLPDGACNAHSECMVFCPNTCLRHLTVNVNGAMPRDIKMIVTDTGNGRSLDLISSIPLNRDRTENVLGRTQHPMKFAKYGAALPKPEGTYSITFEDSNGQPYWPSFAVPVLDVASDHCTDYVTYEDLEFVKPPATRPACSNLVFNGDLEMGDITYWQGAHSTAKLHPMGGVDGSNALLTTGAPGHHIRKGNGITQWIDTSCLVEGSTYDVSINFRQVDAYGEVIPGCTGTSNDCPVADLLPANIGYTFPWHRIAHTDVNSHSDDGSFNTISGQFTATNEMVTAQMVRLAINDYKDQLIIDNVHLTPA